MTIKSSLRKLSRAFAAKDATAFDDAIEELEDKVEDAEGGPKDPDVIEVHNHIPSDDALGEVPPKNPDSSSEVRDEEPEWFKKFSKDCMDSIGSMRDDIGALQKWAKEEGNEPAHQEDDAPTAEESNLEMDSRDAKDDEANKKILGELEFEAPPGTNDKAMKAKDSMYLEDAFQDAVSKAEILAPGIRVPTFDRKAPPAKTAAALFGLRRTALDLAYNKPETRGIIDAAMSGRALDSKRMSNSALRVLFNAVAAQAADFNNRRTGDGSTPRPVHGGGHTVGGKITSIAAINANNAARYGRKTA